MKGRPRVPLWRWGLWYSALALALVIFYGIGTPIWFGLRSLAWIAEFRARRRGMPEARSGEVPMQ